MLALLHAFPDIGLERSFFDRLAMLRNVDPQNPRSWEAISRRDIEREKVCYSF